MPWPCRLQDYPNLDTWNYQTVSLRSNSILSKAKKESCVQVSRPTLILEPTLILFLFKISEGILGILLQKKVYLTKKDEKCGEFLS